IADVAIESAKLAVEMSDLKAKMTATFSALGGGAGTIAMLDKLTTKLGMTRAELAPLAEQLMGMGIQGAALEKQLTALASVKAIGIEGGQEEFLRILKKLEGQSKISSKELVNLYKTGVNVNEIAAQMGMSVKQLEAGLKNGTVSAKAFGSALT